MYLAIAANGADGHQLFAVKQVSLQTCQGRYHTWLGHGRFPGWPSPDFFALHGERSLQGVLTQGPCSQDCGGSTGTTGCV